MDTRNSHRVSSKVWRKWSKQARGVFNAVYEQMVNDQGLFLHPKQEKAPPKHWNTTAWNAAWVAADAIDGHAVVAIEVA